MIVGCGSHGAEEVRETNGGPESYGGNDAA